LPCDATLQHPSAGAASETSQGEEYQAKVDKALVGQRQYIEHDNLRARKD